jgi:hypothetical protein
MTQGYKKLNDTTRTRTLTPRTDFSVITNPHIFLSLPYSFMLVAADDSPTPTDVFSHHGKLKMFVHMSQNVCIFCELCSSFRNWRSQFWDVALCHWVIGPQWFWDNLTISFSRVNESTCPEKTTSTIYPEMQCHIPAKTPQLRHSKRLNFTRPLSFW